MKNSIFQSFYLAVTMLIFNNSYASIQSDSLKSRIIPVDTVIKIKANPKLGFNYPYYLRIPKGLKKNDVQYLLVETNNTGVNDTLEFHEKEAYLQIMRNSLGSSICSNLKVPFLMPVFPRPQKEWTIYTHAFDSDAAKIKNGDMKRMDLQLIAMIKNAREVLKTHEILTKEKILMNGFSASGTFANRFTLIHPELIAGVACGGINAITILPIPESEGKSLKYPLGTKDFEKLFASKFNMKAYQKVPQYFYMGENDKNDAASFDDAYSNSEREIIYELLGKTMIPDRFTKCEHIYAENKVNSTFKTYANIGHETDQTVFMDVYIFFKNIISQ
ncbi:hypothetical protein FLJC2902T_15090 [Flavobacterium limnosediminis JC2902]|uniref:Uncharacterized protein n=1 Tax=Flavobacterium limnosediminis JC2902 TaxID=1341181 RepID=V6SQ99_9FLAO|nr:hypothetical protein [Flavobacterium limnosediminis]ESU28634.1 hypothetical protein FLJC2902T_15090 [Flavobacterium limnosediminis JC2902]